ncbi:MAG: FAD-binding oxidoreductase [Rubricoccaceae bacterium]
MHHPPNAPAGALPRGYLRATLARRHDVTPDLAVFWLRPERPVPFEAGQYVTLALPGADGRPVRRAYSVLSAPHEPLLELFIERVEGGALTPSLFRLPEGAVVGLRPRAAGHFVRDPARHRHVCACTVTGVAPFLSMLRHHAAARATGAELPTERFLVLYGASHAAELGPYADELRRLARDERGTHAGDMPWLVAVPTISRPWDNPGWTGERGRVGDVLRKHLDATGWPPETVAGYACGNPQMVANVRGLLARAGLAPEHVHDELYYTEATGTAAATATATAPAAALPAVASPARTQEPAGRRPGEITLRSAPRPR